MGRRRKYPYRVHSFIKGLVSAFCECGSGGAEVNEINVVHALMGEADSEASPQMNKKLQNAKCSAGVKSGIGTENG